MKRFIEGEDRSQNTLFPEHLDDYIAEDNPVRVIDVFVDELDLIALGFEGMQPEITGRPGYHPASLLKIRPRHKAPSYQLNTASVFVADC
jgi:transposase